MWGCGGGGSLPVREAVARCVVFAQLFFILSFSHPYSEQKINFSFNLSLHSTSFSKLLICH